MQGFFNDFWPLLLALIQIAAMAGAAIHAVLTKSDERAAAGWVGLILLVPFIGWLVYLLIGVNRIERRALELRGKKHKAYFPVPVPTLETAGHLPQKALSSELESLALYGQQIFPETLEPGNTVRILTNGDEAYPAMLKAIRNAKRSIALSTYIFNNDRAGHLFLDALIAADKRGVRVRILIDGVGSWYSFPSLIPLLEKSGLNYTRFLHSFMPWQMPYLNMRNHQKILVLDGRIGFTGGINISKGNIIADNPDRPILDHHFEVEGPVVEHLMQVFANEWNFSTGELLGGADWFPDLTPVGQVLARGLPAGPDMGQNPIRWTLLGAIAQAKNHIRIVTPYFVPDSALRTALSVAAMRGVHVDIVLPQTNNLPYIDWAATPQLEWIARAGCHIWKTPGPFVHSKLMTIDDAWAMVGSANWDDRSLRLNFEFNLECFDADLAAEINLIIDEKIRTAMHVTMKELADLPFHTRLRNAAMRLASPYL
ncbi:MAG: cardiolipin synthase [Rhizobiales bacterium]|nr:cardiolipin synthase [Hyphomicrobiales bacterium]